jgi:2-polyprenyl-6-hydroxyphenyl methylase/3-demethylubiquinone-9 3-methyltransferase
MQENTNNNTIDQDEVSRFAAMASEWWDPNGKFKPLHKFNPVRITYIKEKICEHFDRDINAHDALKGLRILDIGCGGGLLSEPMAKMGAEMVSVDPATDNIEIAKLHAQQSGINIDYRATTAEALEAEGEKFDIVLNMEVVEHVSDVDLFVRLCANMVKPEGLMFVATINRTPKANLLAIIMAENVLKWLPRGTHQYEKLVKPEEIEGPLNARSMQVIDRIGVFFNPLTNSWNRSNDMDVNYMLLAKKAAG